MKFTHKVTARNLFRYQKRLWMTIIGVAGCTALLLTGFGLRNSIGDVVDKQFGELIQYNLTVVLNADDALDDSLRAAIDDTGVVERYLLVALRNAKVSSDRSDTAQSVSMIVSSDDAVFTDYVTLRERRGHAAVSFDPNSVVITEKLGEQLGVGVGDTITLSADGRQAQVPDYRHY